MSGGECRSTPIFVRKKSLFSVNCTQAGSPCYIVFRSVERYFKDNCREVRGTNAVSVSAVCLDLVVAHPELSERDAAQEEQSCLRLSAENECEKKSSQHGNGVVAP